MKARYHPHYRHVVFHDTSADVWFKIGSTIKTHRTVEFERRNAALRTPLDVSSASHVFYTGKQKDFAKEGQHGTL